MQLCPSPIALLPQWWLGYDSTGSYTTLTRSQPRCPICWPPGSPLSSSKPEADGVRAAKARPTAKKCRNANNSIDSHWMTSHEYFVSSRSTVLLDSFAVVHTRVLKKKGEGGRERRETENRAHALHTQWVHCWDISTSFVELASLSYRLRVFLISLQYLSYHKKKMNVRKNSLHSLCTSNSTNCTCIP